MAVPAKIGELHLRNTAASRADDAESRYGRRLPHNSSKTFGRIMKSPNSTLVNSQGDLKSKKPGDDSSGVPTFVIRPTTGWQFLDLRELWVYRELIYFLTWRDIKVRYKQTAIGVVWAVLQPLAMMIVFTLFFGRLAKIPSDGVPYPLFAYAALLPW